MTKLLSAIAAALAAALFFTATVAHAEEESFTYYNKELRTEAEMLELLKRLRMRARFACRTDLRMITKAEKKCRSDVEAEWIAQIGNPNLARLAALKHSLDQAGS